MSVSVILAFFTFSKTLTAGNIFCYGMKNSQEQSQVVDGSWEALFLFRNSRHLFRYMHQWYFLPPKLKLTTFVVGMYYEK
jgi:hypothetical protein